MSEELRTMEISTMKTADLKKYRTWVRKQLRRRESELGLIEFTLDCRSIRSKKARAAKL